MNCNTHGDTAAVAFCRTCGKPLCNNCTRDVRGVIYCEACLAARMEGTARAAGFVPPPPPPQTGYQQFMDQGLGVKVQPGPASGPNPAVAGILAGFFPIGVGAVYTGQYAKGLAHLAIAVLMIVAQSSDVPGYMHLILGLAMGFFYVYQIIDSVRTAKAIQTGEPAPDPFGLAQMFGTGEKFEGTKVPVGAALLIGLGVLFLINTVFDFSLHRYWPLILIGLGVWLFAKHWGLLGTYRPTCVCERCRTRKLMGPALLVTIGMILLLSETSSVGWDKTWPAILLVIGVVKLMQSNASSDGHFGPLPPGVYPGVPQNVSQNIPPSVPPSAPPPPQPTQSTEPPASSSGTSGEVNNV
jgi:LiaF transmembrane domain/B-box zinc finger